jgi:hypothetical protein
MRRFPRPQWEDIQALACLHAPWLPCQVELG